MITSGTPMIWVMAEGYAACPGASIGFVLRWCPVHSPQRCTRAAVKRVWVAGRHGLIYPAAGRSIASKLRSG